MTPEKLLEKLKIDSNQRTQKTLESIYKICSEQEKKGENDFSYTTISRLGKNFNIPKAQSIRNKSGEKYRVLINSFKKHTENKTKNISETDWIKKISDPASRILVNQLISENKRLKNKIAEIIPHNTLITIHDKRQNSEFELNFTELEKRSLKYILSDSFKNKNLLTEDEYGRYIDQLGEVFLPTATTHAIRKVISYFK